MTETVRPTPTQRVIAAMWRIDQPAMVRDIAATAALDFATTTESLSRLRSNRHVIRSESGDGTELWYLDVDTDTTLDIARPDTGEQHIPPPPPESGGGTPAKDDSSAAGPAAADPHTPARRTADTGLAEPTQAGTGHRTTPPHIADDSPAGASRLDASPARSPRPYRKPVRPRRPQGALRQAALTVLTDEPDREFRVSEVRKAINAALPDGCNQAGDGAVSNALARLVGETKAVLVGQQPATYRRA